MLHRAACRLQHAGGPGRIAEAAAAAGVTAGSLGAHLRRLMLRQRARGSPSRRARWLLLLLLLLGSAPVPAAAAAALTMLQTAAAAAVTMLLTPVLWSYRCYWLGCSGLEPVWNPAGAMMPRPELLRQGWHVLVALRSRLLRETLPLL